MSRILRLGSIGLLLLVAGCVNQAGRVDPYSHFAISTDQWTQAQDAGLPYVKSRRGNFQTIQPLEFQTLEFGLVRLEKGFVSDGSSRPFDKNLASTKAALLHDALYRGAKELNFTSGYRGNWTKQQADSAYCDQLKILGAPPRLAKTNCLAVRLLSGKMSIWSFHQKRREDYWASRRIMPTG